MSVKMLRLSVCVKHLSGWSKNVQFSRNFASRSGKLSADATAAAAASISQRKIELKEPIGTEKLQNYFDSEIKNGDIVPVFKRALLFGNKIAIKDSTGEYTYRQILEAAHKFSHELSAHSYGEHLEIYFKVPNVKFKFSPHSLCKRNKSSIFMSKHGNIHSCAMGLLDFWPNW